MPGHCTEKVWAPCTCLSFREGGEFVLGFISLYLLRFSRKDSGGVHPQLPSHDPLAISVGLSGRTLRSDIDSEFYLRDGSILADGMRAISPVNAAELVVREGLEGVIPSFSCLAVCRPPPCPMESGGPTQFFRTGFLEFSVGFRELPLLFWLPCCPIA
jgi:hypothetical protein